MAQGKFSNPRPHRDEERQIEETFRQLTGQAPVKKAPPREVTEATQKLDLPLQDFPAEEAFALPGTAAPEEAFPQSLEDAVQESFRQPSHPAGGAYEKIPDVPTSELLFDEDAFAEEAPSPAEDFLDKALAFYSQNKKLVLAFGCAAALLLLVGVISLFFAGSADPYDGLILDNVYIADIHVGGLSKKDAITVMNEATDQTFTKLPMIIDLAGHALTLSPQDTGAKLDVKSAVDAAFAIGRTGTEEQRQAMVLSLRTHPQVIALLNYLDLNEEYILTTLRTYAENAGSTLTQTTYGLEGTQPELATDTFNKNAPTQTLVITMGTPGIGFDYQDVYNQVLDAYSLNQFQILVEDVESVKDPDPIDLEAIYEEFYIEPVDASVDLQTFEPIPGSYGYAFDLEEAQKLVAEAQPGQEIRIPMEYVEPEILDAEMLFQDVLGESAVSHTSQKDRDKNLSLACEALDGTIVNPGEQFSFNAVVGERSSANGYKKAYEVIRKEQWEEDEEIRGGGISQVASALYHSALLADMQIDYRVSQDFAPGYIADGLDAYVDWRTPNLQFTNTSGYPIRIDASADSGKVTIQIMGVDERSHYIKIETAVTATETPGTKFENYEFDNPEGLEDGDVIRKGIKGYTVKSYKCKYDKASGQLISRDFAATSKYRMLDEIVAKVKPEPTTEATTEATEPPTDAPTDPQEPTEPPATQAPTDPPATQAPTDPPATQAPTDPPAPSSEITEPSGSSEDSLSGADAQNLEDEASDSVSNPA